MTHGPIYDSADPGDSASALDYEESEHSGRVVRIASVAALGGLLFGYDSAVINGASDPAVDSQGNRYVVSQSTVSRITPAGVTTVVAGNGVNCLITPVVNSCFSGDGGPALAAQLYFPSGATVDQAGNLFIADTGNRRIREVSTSGIITTYAGGGGNTGEGVQALPCSRPQPSVNGSIRPARVLRLLPGDDV